jgi:RND family efflux transporter MFP subunit
MAATGDMANARRRGGATDRRPLVLAQLLLLSLALAGCGQGSGEKPAEADIAPVSLHRVGNQQSETAIEATGTVRLRRETPLAFVSDGRLRSVQVREGDMVRGGQVLADLDRTAIDAASISADARARQAAAELARQKELLRQGWVAKARVESAEAAARAADADRSAARFSQRFATITAPAGGVVLARLAEPGQTLAAGTPVVILGEFGSGFVLRVPMAAGDMAGLSRGETAAVSFRDGAAPAMSARIIEIAGRADPRTGTFQVEFGLPAHPALRSGLIADVSMPRRGSGGPVVIPSTAVFAARADEGFVWRYDQASRKITARLVQLGKVTRDGVEVREGLARGDLIVGAGVDRLIEGQRVKPVQTTAA